MRTLSLLLLLAGPVTAAPNVLVVITDDQGYGDLGCHGNPHVRTPNLDRFARESVWLKHFRVSPVCSPTRSSLLTGQYNYRVGVVDTFVGRSMLRPGVKTLAEYLNAAGYRTGLFGKWHLGDIYPLRPEDRGFQKTLWHQGGGLAQPADHPDLPPATAYFDPILTRDGKEERTKGYCTDVFTDAAIDFLSAEPGTPFFAYLAYNAPHDPFQVADELAAPYRTLDLTPAGFPKIGQPWANGPKFAPEATARAYAMIENIDTNFGRLMKTLTDRKLADDTLVVFLSDNGPGGVRFNAGLRARKGSVYDGGLRVPCYVRGPGLKAVAGQAYEATVAHIDLTPTLLAACEVSTSDRFDGLNLWQGIRGKPLEPPVRTLFFQWHRGDVPEKGRAFAAVGPRYKLVQTAGVQEKAKWTPKLELFDIVADPFEQTDLAAKLPDEVKTLEAEYTGWFADVTKFGFDPPRLVVGSDKQNPVRLSKQDWRGATGWGPADEGHWLVRVERDGRFIVGVRSRTRFDKFGYEREAATGKESSMQVLAKPDTRTKFLSRIGTGDYKVSAWVETNGVRRAADYIEFERSLD